MTASASSSAQTPAKANNSCRRTSVRTSKMLQAREFCGNLIPFNKGRCNFNEEFQKAQACHPVVKLYHQRLIQRGAVQSYEGHAERTAIYDFDVFSLVKCLSRIYKFCNTTPSTGCWRRGDQDDRPN
ncbi:unnamed protein product [Malus baccata var. baccata]